MKIWQNVYEGLNFSNVKFYNDLSAGFEKLPQKPQNLGDNLPLASISINWAKRLHFKRVVTCGWFNAAYLYTSELEGIRTVGVSKQRKFATKQECNVQTVQTVEYREWKYIWTFTVYLMYSSVSLHVSNMCKIKVTVRSTHRHALSSGLLHTGRVVHLSKCHLQLEDKSSTCFALPVDFSLRIPLIVGIIILNIFPVDFNVKTNFFSFEY